MTSQQLADTALSIFQSERERGTPDYQIAALLDQFFSFPTSNEYERQLSCVTEIFSAKPIFLSDLPSHLAEAL